jgi:hypothetical protein
MSRPLLIWRFASNGAVDHAFRHRDDPQALCGREVRFVLGTWLDSDGTRRKCRSCVSNLPSYMESDGK